MKVVYYANDGKKFDSRETCEAYEKQVCNMNDDYNKIINMIDEFNKKHKRCIRLSNDNITIDDLISFFK